MALLSKRNSFFSYENDDITSSIPSEDVESEVREEVELENQIDNEVATVEEEGEVIESLAEQAVDNAELIENHPEEVTEEIVQESNKQYLLALGRLGMGSADLHYVRLGFESSNTPLQNLRINQESVMDNIKKFFAKIWEWIKSFGKKIKEFFVGIGKSFTRLGQKLKTNKTSKEVDEALKNMNDESINVNMNGIASFTSFLDYIKLKPKDVSITELVNTFLPQPIFNKNESLLNLVKKQPRSNTRIFAAASNMDSDNQFISVSTEGEYGTLIYLKLTGLYNEPMSKLGQQYLDSNAEMNTKDEIEFIKTPLPEVSEDKIRECIKEFINSESKLKALEQQLNTSIVSLQKKSSDAINKCISEFEKMISEFEKSINAESTPESIKVTQFKIKVLNGTKTIINEFRKSQSYLLLVFTAIVNNAAKFLK